LMPTVFVKKWKSNIFYLIYSFVKKLLKNIKFKSF
jgi:hypothetical protein